MRRFVTAVALFFSVTAPAFAGSSGPFVVKKSGHHFSYKSEMRGDIIRITGKMIDTGEKFSLSVSPSGRVDGHIGYRSVNYSVAKSTRDRLAAKLTREEGLALADASQR